MDTVRVLLAGTDHRGLEDALSGQDGVQCRSVGDTSRVRGAVDASGIDCVVVTGAVDGTGPVQLLAQLRERGYDLPVVVWPPSGGLEQASAAVRHDASEYLPGADVGEVVDRVAEVVVWTDPTTDGGTAFSALADSVADAIVTIDADSRVVFANDGVRDVFGYDPEDLLGGSLFALMPDRFHDQHEAAVDRYVESGDRTLDWDYVELAAENADGEEFPVAVSFGEFTADGRLFFTGVVRDITERKRRERAFETLTDAGHRLMDAPSRDAVCDLAVQLARDLFEERAVGLWLHDEDAEVLQPAAASTEARALVDDLPTFRPDESIAWETFREGEVRYYDELRDESGLHNEDTQVRSEIQLPLGDHGVMNVGSTDRGAFNDLDVAIARAFATTVESALDRALRESQLRLYRGVIENVRDHIYVLDETGRIELLTDELAALGGYDPGELRGEHVASVLPDAGLERGAELIRDLVENDDRSSGSFESAIRTDDGEEIPVEIELSLLSTETFSGSVGVVHDLRDLQAARERLQDARERFTYLFDHIPDAVVEAEFVDGEPVVRSVNDAFEEVFGYDPDAVVGRSFNEFVLTESQREEGRALDERAEQGEVVTSEVRRRTAWGVRHFLFRGVPYRTGADPTRGFGIYTDITDRKERERRLQVLTTVLRHNLRTEMNLVLGHADRILRTDPDDEVRSIVQDLRESAETVVDLGETARELEGVIERAWSGENTVDLADIAGTVAEEVAGDDPAVDLRTDLPASATVVGDEPLRRAVAELVENAVVHGGTTVAVTVEPVDDNWVELRVADDGPGIPDYERELVAGDREITQLEHGSGLGLWIVEWTVASLGGSLSLETRRSGGTVATVRLERA